MPSAGGTLLSFVVGPAIVAAFLAWRFTLNSERVKARREYATKLSDQVRDDVREAVETSVQYFTEVETTKRPLLAAQVLLLEHEVRAGVKLLRDSCGEDHHVLSETLQGQFLEFLAALTGGTFQQAGAQPDQDQANAVVATGSTLRGAIIHLRRQQLEDEFDPSRTIWRRMQRFIVADNAPALRRIDIHLSLLVGVWGAYEWFSLFASLFGSSGIYWWYNGGPALILLALLNILRITVGHPTLTRFVRITNCLYAVFQAAVVVMTQTAESLLYGGNLFAFWLMLAISLISWIRADQHQSSERSSAVAR